MDVEVRPGLRLEIAGRELSASRGPAQRRRIRCDRYLLAVPAAALLVLLLVPMGWTLSWALREDPLGHFAAVLTDPGALAAARNSVIWVAIALALVAAGYGIAVLSRMVSRVLLYVLILPFGMSAVVSGAVFRLIFDPNPERGMATALFGDGVAWLGPGLIWLVLASAFAWTWLGFVVVLFRAGLSASPGRRRPGPVLAIVVLTVVVAAIRMFDLVLIVPPGSVRDEVDVVGLHWWRMVSRSGETGDPAALAVLLFVIVAAMALAGIWGTRRTRREPAGVVEAVEAVEPAPVPSTRRAWSRVLGIGIGAFWLLPVVILAATALHEPAAAAVSGWWNPRGMGLGSFAALADSWLWPALVGNLFLAGLATALVVAAAAPAAYLLVWGGLPRWLSGALTVLLVVLAVAPVQMYAGPLSEAVADLGLSGSRTPLALIHAAAGLPFAVLVLRTAFEAARVRAADERPSLDAMWRRTRYRPAVIAVVVLEFLLVWNDFIVGFLISGPGPTPFTLLLWGEARQFGNAAGTVAAASVAAALIPVAVLLVSWPRVVDGLTGGARR